VVLGVKRLVSAAVASIPFCHEPVQRRERAREPAIADVVPRSNGRMNSSREWGRTRFHVVTPRLPLGGVSKITPFGVMHERVTTIFHNLVRLMEAGVEGF